MKAEAAPDTPERWSLHLFVSGNNPASIEARAQVKAFVERHLGDRGELRVTDVLEDPEAALANKVVAVPMLVLLEPPPRVTLLGSLRDTPRVLAALRIPGKD